MKRNVNASFSGEFDTDKSKNDEVDAGDAIGRIFRNNAWNPQRTNFAGSITDISTSGGQVTKNDVICTVEDGTAQVMEALREPIRPAAKKKAPPKKRTTKKKTAPKKKAPAKKKKPAKKKTAPKKKAPAKKKPAKKKTAPKKQTAPKKKAAKKKKPRGKK